MHVFFKPFCSHHSGTCKTTWEVCCKSRVIKSKKKKFVLNLSVISKKMSDSEDLSDITTSLYHGSSANEAGWEGKVMEKT